MRGRRAIVGRADARRPSLVLAALLLVAPGCASRWPDTRREVIDPVQELLHRSFPRAIQANDSIALRDLYLTTQIAPDLAAFLDRFQRVDVARAVIKQARFETDAVHAKVWLVVEGVLKGGAAVYTDQWRDMTASRLGGLWKIAADSGGKIAEVSAPGPRFVDETARRGISFRYVERWTPDAGGVPRRQIFASGPAVGDVDGNGWDDVVLVNGDRIVLYLNDGGHFRDATVEWGLGGPIEGSHTATLLVDLDGDGRLDLFTPAEYAQPLLFRNTGTRFEPWRNSGIVTRERTTSACAADFDGDGRVDLYLANNEDPHRMAPEPQGAARNANPDQLFLNQGDGTFRDAGAEAGVGNTGWSPIGRRATPESMAALATADAT